MARFMAPQLAKPNISTAVNMLFESMTKSLVENLS